MLHQGAALASGGDVRQVVSSRARYWGFRAIALGLAGLGIVAAHGLLQPTSAHAATLYTYTHTNTITTASGTGDPLSGPSDLVADTSDNVLFVLDSGNNRVVRYNLTTGAYLGTIQMPAGQTPFNSPQGIACQPATPGVRDSERLLVVDTGNNRLILMSHDGVIRNTLTLAAGLVPVRAVWSPTNKYYYVLTRLPGAGTSEVRIYELKYNQGNSQLSYVSSIRGTAATNSVLAPDARGINLVPATLPGGAAGLAIAVADTGNNRVVRFTLAGAFLGTFGTYSSTPIPLDGTLNRPGGIGSRSDGYLPVVDTGNHHIEVFASAAGGNVVAELGSAGVPGTGLYQFNSPMAALSINTTVGIVADTGNNRIMFYALTPGAARTPINYDGVGCTDCHIDDLREEHAVRARGCRSCHRTSTENGEPEYTAISKLIDQDLLANGSTELENCGTNSAHCHSVTATNPSTGESLAMHGMDGDTIRGAHQPVDASGLRQTTTSCTGTAGGCHSLNSSESPFWFGAYDLASAKSDYYYHQARGSAGADYVTDLADDTGTVSLTTLDHQCLTCHGQQRAVPRGSAERAAALATPNGVWTCTSAGCHDASGTSGKYAQPTCFRTPTWQTLYAAAPSAMSLVASEGAQADAAAASAFYQPLLDLVFGATPEPGEVSILADPLSLPESATPATRPVSIDYILSGVMH